MTVVRSPITANVMSTGLLVQGHAKMDQTTPIAPHGLYSAKAIFLIVHVPWAWTQQPSQT